MHVLCKFVDLKKKKNLNLQFGNCLRAFVLKIKIYELFYC